MQVSSFVKLLHTKAEDSPNIKEIRTIDSRVGFISSTKP